MYIFQYGSNVEINRLNAPERLRDAATRVGRATTVDRFDLQFNVYSCGQKCGVANLIPGGRIIYGALYDIPDDRVYRDKKINGLKTLDEIEGKRYHRELIRVCHGGGTCDAVTYLASPAGTELKTARDYTNHITSGLRVIGAPQEYIDYVERCIERSLALP